MFFFLQKEKSLLFLKEVGNREIPWDNKGVQEIEYSLEKNTTA